MKIKIIKIIIVITAIIWWLGRAGTVEAVIKRAGEIEVITDEPLFADSIVWYPGLRVEKSFQVKNRGRGAKTVQVETENETETKQLARVLTVQIKEGARGVFGITENKTLRNFFDYGAITLGEVFGDDSGKIFSLAVAMPAAAGNEYQAARAEFDLRIGFVGDSSSTVTVSAGGTAAVTPTAEETVLAGGTGKPGRSGGSEEIEGKEGTEGPEGGRQYPGVSGEVKGAQAKGINWGFLAMIGGLLASAGLAGWAWLRLRRKQVY